ncbi:MAG: HEAT repeat domain-containing protein [Phycisphaerae bacterium]
MHSSRQRHGRLQGKLDNLSRRRVETVWAAWAIGALAMALTAARPAQAQTTTPASAPATSTAPAASPEDAMACESLRHSFRELSIREAPARAARMIALVGFADKLVPGDCRTKLLLASVYEAQAQIAKALAALQPCAEADPSDHVLAMRWLRLKLIAEDSADGRVRVLRDIANSPGQTDATRSEAAARCGRVLLGMPDSKREAMKAFDQALKFDPGQPLAITDRLSNIASPTPLERLDGMLNMLQGNPTYFQASAEAANVLDGAGVYDRAVEFYEYTWKIYQLRKQEDLSRGTQTFLTQYFNGLLDAAQALHKTGPASTPAGGPGERGPAKLPSASAPATAAAAGDMPLKGGPVDFVPSEAQADMARKAIKIFEPLIEKYPQSVDLRSMLVEAYRAAGLPEKADAAVKDMEAAYVKKTKDAITLSSNLAGEMAWFYVMTLPDPAKALDFAQKAESINATDADVQRVLGAAELLSPKADFRRKGFERLGYLARGGDNYSAVLLAEYDLANDDKTGFMEMARAVAGRGRSGPAFRRLCQLADGAGIDVPLARDARNMQEDLRKRLGQFDPRYLEVALAPDKYISVTIKPAPASVSVGQPLVVEAVLTDLSDLKIPLGDWGLFSPTIGFTALAPQGDKAGPFKELPMAVWPAPRYLVKGQQPLSCKARLDVGALAAYLNCRPLEDVTITIESMVDPVQKESKFNSSLPSLRVEPVTITRTSLLTLAPDADLTSDAGLVKAYTTMLGVITQKDILRGELPQRMLAARRVAALLSYAQAVEAGKATLPKALVGTFDRLTILAMFQALLKDPSATVRAEAITAMEGLAPDEHVVALVRPLVDDPSPLVRLRVAELLGANWPKRAVGQDKILEQLAGDADPQVKMMAGAFRAPERPR